MGSGGNSDRLLGVGKLVKPVWKMRFPEGPAILLIVFRRRSSTGGDAFAVKLPITEHVCVSAPAVVLCMN